MLAIEGTYQNGQVTLSEPVKKENLSKKTKVVVLFIEENISNKKPDSGLAKLQESTGFAREVLGNPAEDVWNDL